MSKKLLSEMFGLVPLPAINNIREDDEIDRINKQLSGAKSVAGSGGGERPRVGADGATQRAQSQLDTAKSVFKKEAAGTAGGLQITGDKETLGALMECLQEGEHGSDDPDLATWARSAWKAVAAGIRGNGTVVLPKFEKTPDDMMPDEGGEEF